MNYLIADDCRASLPAPIVYAHRLVRRQAELRQQSIVPWLQPDAKSQVSFRYIDGQPTQIEAVVLSTQHDAGMELEALRAAVLEHVIEPMIPAHFRA